MIKLQEYKEPQHHIGSGKFLNPKKLYLPLSQHTGRPSSACVKVGDQVKETQMIAKEDGFISTRLHAPKKGKVINIDKWGHPNLKKAECIVIQCEDEEKRYVLNKNTESLKKDELPSMSAVVYRLHFHLSMN